jgi:nitroreductase family protein
MRRASLREVVNVVAYATLAREYRLDDGELSRRPSPSAGAIHPLDVLIIDGAQRSPRVLRYDSRQHALDLLELADSGMLAPFAFQVREILPDALGTSLVLLGQAAKVAARYEHPMSLLWRDAGVLLQTLFLTAAAFRLAFCPLGILGHEVVHAIGAESDPLSLITVFEGEVRDC